MRLLSLLAATFVLSTTVNAAESDSVYLVDQEKLIIPHLVIGAEIFYAQLDRTAGSLNFSLNLEKSVRVTPQDGDQWATAEEVIGSWSPAGSGVTITFNADNTYSWDVPARSVCPAGVESGTWTLDADTGVVFFRAVDDNNGVCGASHAAAAVRLSRDGDNLTATISRRQAGQQVDTDLTLAPVAE